jgi:hypothetical protein
MAEATVGARSGNPERLNSVVLFGANKRKAARTP